MNQLIQTRTHSNVILHIAPITQEKISGLTSAIPPLVNTLQNLGVQTGLLTTSQLGSYKKPETYPVVHIRDLPLYPAIASMPAPLNQPDLIIFHSTYILQHIPLVYEALQRKIPYIITPHGGMTRQSQQQKQLKKKVGNFCFFNWMVRHAAALHCLNEQEAIDVKNHWHHPVFVVNNGVNIPPKELLANPGSKSNLKFLFLGRLDINHKGLDLLLAACGIIQEILRKSQVQISFYGSTINDSRIKLQELINKYQIQDLISLHEPVLGKAKQDVFQSTDLFLHTSRFEGQPIAVLEALSYGIPCLLTPGTNMADEVEAVGAGWKVNANPEAIAQGIKDVLAARFTLANKGKVARNLIETKYSWPYIGNQLLREYSNILYSPSPSADVTYSI